MSALPFDALALGASYALLASGFTLVFGVLRRVNLAYGATVMFGLYAAIRLTAPLPPVAALVAAPLVAVAATLVANLYVERLCFAPHRGGAKVGTHVTAMAASFAVWMQVEEASVLLLPAHANPFPSPFARLPAAWQAGPLRADHAIAFGCAVLATLGCWLLIHRTRFGLAVRAVVDDAEAAAFMGVDVRRVSARVFALAAALGALGGCLIAGLHGQVSAMFAMWATLKGLAAAVLGGFGSMPGAIAGGLALGAVETVLQARVGAEYRDLASNLLLLAVLCVRPGGLASLVPGTRARAALLGRAEAGR
ncbi:branched-chain amino acid ABC transporter permease [Burkholderia ubonensis]|uniref:branched-chain amino acid ABC transporter permease n=1 Tax=Burkholderia ubonensis TaxID=101571 RepID=UPI000752C82E|nr:branched-chain amino acid ABC transporter permease [Burkholderia ubonensis]KWC96860.1 branched-chain amino acid ABC transporter permease [Burkholderia ubonensis]KWD09458.1 branched-chain amino acid ABC transporter permease [Burkholderia ubonensis]KWO96519.1 branched-chain amino acid ABC transporter permease [Burkholderia ubonensis]